MPVGPEKACSRSLAARAAYKPSRREALLLLLVRLLGLPPSLFSSLLGVRVPTDLAAAA